jgi:hypothetical protein
MTALSVTRTNYKTILMDIMAVLVITFLPAISHLISIPLYLFEPMRVILVLSIMFTARRNSYLIALALPLFSFIISAHPVFVKLFLISSELFLNIYLFSLLEKKIGNIFTSLLVSIFLCKIYYYIVKAGLISVGLMQGELVSTPIYLQVIIALVLSLIAFIYINKNTESAN